MERLSTLLCICIICGGLIFDVSAQKLSLSSNNKKLLEYNAEYIPSPDPKAPWFGRSGFIHPVYSPSGRIVTEGFPKEKLHQHGLMMAWTSAEYMGSPVDFWNSHKQQGYIEHVETIHADKNNIQVALRHIVSGKKKNVIVLNEVWDIQSIPHTSMHVFDITSIQTCATESPLKIRKYHYGGMCVRGPSSWNSGDHMVTSLGNTQANGNHTRPDWVAIFGKVDGIECGIAAMSHPENYRSPQPVRLHSKLPYFCFAPMVLGEFLIKPETLYISKFRFVAFDGKPNKNELDLIWKEFKKSNITKPD